jgi:hypothetical protein
LPKSAKADTIRDKYLMACPGHPVHHSVMSASSSQPESITSGQTVPTAAAHGARPLLAGLLVYCSTLTISVAAAATLVSQVPAELLLVSF